MVHNTRQLSLIFYFFILSYTLCQSAAKSYISIDMEPKDE